MKSFIALIKSQLRHIGLITILTLFLFNIFSKVLRDKNVEAIDFLSFINIIEDPAGDYRLRKYVEQKTKNKKDPEIVLADIDDQSLKEIGRWPWSRNQWIIFMKKMQEAGAKVVAFDVMFSEPEVACNDVSPDIKFAEAIKEYQKTGGKVILPFLFSSNENFFKQDELPDVLLENMVDAKTAPGLDLYESQISNETFPVKELLKASPALGNISMSPDNDGVFRNYTTLGNVLFADFGPVYLPSISVSAFNAYYDGNRKVEITITKDGEHYLTSEKDSLKRLEVDYGGNSMIRYYGGTNYFPRMSFKEILSDKTDTKKLKEFFHNKIVFVGSTSVGAHDLRNTPIDPALPGVYAHMNFLRMIMDQFYFRDMLENLMVSGIFAVIGCTLIIIIQHFFKNAILDITVLFLFCAALYLADKKYFIPEGYQLKLITVGISYIFTYSWNTVINFYLSNKEKKQIKGAFSRYVAPAIVNQMLDNPDKLKLGGEKKEITCIFSDVRDFTSISEKLNPTQLSTALNIYMSKMTDILFETYGTLDKYIGDAIVGYWGAPLAIENHAYHAVRGSVKMIESLPAINQSFKEQGFPEFKVGIGLNSGECSVGNMGSDKIFSYTALGDNMNLGSRLESLCKYYGVQIHISENTYNLIPDNLKTEFKFRPIDRMRVKGKEQPVNTLEVLHSTHPFYNDEKALKKYNEAYQMYLNKQFPQSLVLVNELLELYPQDKPSQLIKKNCEHYMDEPPGADWDGVTVHKEK